MAYGYMCKLGFAIRRLIIDSHSIILFGGLKKKVKHIFTKLIGSIYLKKKNRKLRITKNSYPHFNYISYMF